MKDREFKFIEGLGKKIIWIESNRIDECMRYYREHQLKGVAISPRMGYAIKDLDFLREHSYITSVDLPAAESIDISPLESLADLTYLLLDDSKQTIDFAQFPKLSELRLGWHRKMDISPHCDALRILYLSKYKPKTKDLTSLPELPDLEKLEIVQAPIQSIKGIERFLGLRKLQLVHLAKLEHINAVTGLANRHLDTLDCDTCRKIRDLDVVRSLTLLRILRFNRCGEIPNIRFLKQMPNLEDFRFVDTNVVDGDLSPCLGLKSVGFFRKKHYSHTPEEMDALLEGRT